MKRYMLVCKVTGEQFVLFADTDTDAHNTYMDVSCGIGGDCEVYERAIDEDGVESYVLQYA